MLISLFSPKGGTGTSTCSALVAKSVAQYIPTLLIEAVPGDLQPIVAADETPKFTFFDWAVSPQPTSDSLKRISTYVLCDLDFVAGSINPSSSSVDQDKVMVEHGHDRLPKDNAIIDAIVGLPGACVVDCGRADQELHQQIIQASDIAIMVLRQCYLGLFSAAEHNLKEQIDACIVVCESGRAISTRQIAKTLAVHTLIEVDARRDFAKAIDAGVLLHRTPDKMIAPIDAFFRDIMSSQKYNSNDREDIDDFWARSSTNCDPLTSMITNKYSQYATSLLRKQK